MLTLYSVLFKVRIYVLKTIVKDKVSLSTIFKGVIPFIGMDIVRLIILLLLPFLTLFLPNSIWS